MQSDDLEIHYSKKLVLFDRIYKDEKKFGGTDDSFDYKLLLFYDKCRRAGLSKRAYIYGTPIMLTGQTQSRFYKTRNTILIFDEFCEGMRDYFEKDEWKRHNLNKWHTIIFADVIKINSILSTAKCFRKLCDELNILQKNIDSEFHESKHFREIIVRTCKKHSALIAVLIRPPDRPSALVKDLYASIVSHEVIQKSSNAYTQHEGDRPESFYTDRQYHRGGSNFRSGSNSRKNTSQSRKKCFVCDKEECWSTKHTEHERNEASFDLSSAAQTTQPTTDDITALNKRLRWQLDNPKRGLAFVKLDRKTLQLVVFTDSSFANNRDLSSQIEYVICLANATNKANIIHWSFVKYKRVTRSVLAAELYEMVHEFDLNAVIKGTFTKIMQTDIPLVLCTDSKSLYECLVKFGITQEKRLMIDVMSLRQSYERREVIEVKWIHGQNNSANSMTKIKPNTALKTIIETNHINLNTIEWIKRTKTAEDEEKHEVLEI